MRSCLPTDRQTAQEPLTLYPSSASPSEEISQYQVREALGPKKVAGPVAKTELRFI
jgi:hypothetical protein